MKKILQPKIIIPAILSIGLLASLFAVADVKTVLRIMESFQHVYLLYFLVAMVAYEIVRGMQWHYLLESMNIHVPVRTQIFSFAMGEITKSLPIGNYFQNYVLQQSKGTDFGRSSAATTLIVLNEVAVCLIGVVILGLGTWTVWLRPLIIFGVLALALAVWTFHKLHHQQRTPEWMTKHEAWRKALDELRQFRAGVADLLHPRILIIQFFLGAVYVVIAGSSMYLIARGLGVDKLSYSAVLSVYFFSLAFGLIFPLPVDVGVTELSGVGAFLAVGLDKNDAVSIMLINRVLSIGAALAIALIVMAVLHDELRAALRSRADPADQSANRTPSKGSQAAGGC
ncbi:MAG TPA: lysylphosphatidylglycerol synthase transmembrane domain-containing protein [Chloroflexota bacterium]|nr:lysylphosphatidylglycerol synthase transmembrane domain-containing protein [Chloroflexota bacterium]